MQLTSKKTTNRRYSFKMRTPRKSRISGQFPALLRYSTLSHSGQSSTTLTSNTCTSLILASLAWKMSMVAPYYRSLPRSPKSIYSRVDYLPSHTSTLIRQILSLPITSVLQTSQNVSVTLEIGLCRKSTTSDNSKIFSTWNSSQTSCRLRALVSLALSRMLCQVCLSGMKKRAITTPTSI